MRPLRWAAEGAWRGQGRRPSAGGAGVDEIRPETTVTVRCTLAPGRLGYTRPSAPRRGAGTKHAEFTLTARQQLVTKPLRRSCQQPGMERLHSRPNCQPYAHVSPLPDISAVRLLLGAVGSREQATTAQRGPAYWYSRLACIRRVLCVRPCATIKNLPDIVAQAWPRSDTRYEQQSADEQGCHSAILPCQNHGECAGDHQHQRSAPCRA